MTFAARTFARRTAFFGSTTRNVDGGTRREAELQKRKSLRSADQNRSARPELQNAFGPTLQERPFEAQGNKGGAPEKAKSRFVGRETQTTAGTE
jgi:hypothetical protein